VAVTGHKPTALLTIDSTKVDAAKLTALEDILYGTVGDDARLPLPDEVIALVGTGVTNVDMNRAANQPTFVNGTGVVTLPAVTGVQWKVNGVNKAPLALSPRSRRSDGHVEAVASRVQPRSATTSGRSSGSSYKNVRGRDSQVRVVGNNRRGALLLSGAVRVVVGGIVTGPPRTPR
jgi:hypothetical protein